MAVTTDGRLRKSFVIVGVEAVCKLWEPFTAVFVMRTVGGTSVLSVGVRARGVLSDDCALDAGNVT